MYMLYLQPHYSDIMCIQKIKCSYEQKVSVLSRHSFGSSHNLSSPMNVGEERLCDESKEHLQKRLAKGPNIFLFCFCNSTSQSRLQAGKKGWVSRKAVGKNPNYSWWFVLRICTLYVYGGNAVIN